MSSNAGPALRRGARRPTVSRMARALAAVAAVAAVAAIAAGGTDTFRVTSLADGDTLSVSGGARVRLVQIDTPELGSGECYSRAAANELRRLVPAGSSVALEADPALDKVDRYGRLLRYVTRGGVNVNVELVRRGAATVWFYGGDRGRYARQLLAAAEQARRDRRGLWGACPAARWNTSAAADTGTSGPPAKPRTGGCDPAYPDVCIPPPPPDLDCADVSFRRFRVVGADPHRFDANRDGIGCESG
jgi:micrococcal nuclease